MNIGEYSVKNPVVSWLLIIIMVGGGLLAFDGDREIVLDESQSAILRVTRDGPWVIDPSRAMVAAAEQGLYRDLGHWHDQRSGATGCC